MRSIQRTPLCGLFRQAFGRLLDADREGFAVNVLDRPARAGKSEPSEESGRTNLCSTRGTHRRMKSENHKRHTQKRETQKREREKPKSNIYERAEIGNL